MATPLTPTQILAAVQSSGLPIYEMPGWRGRCRCHDGNHEQGIGPNGRGWGGINGVVVHHTAGPMNSGQAAIDYTVNILNRGRTDTPGPLVQFSIDADGRVIICAAGRSNQAGAVSSVAINHMIAADFSLTSPYQDVRGSDADGNTHTFGIEIQAPDVPNAIQVDAAERLSAAICKAYGWTGQETCAHGEIASSKAQSDPGLDMGLFRRTVMGIVSGSAPGTGAGGGVPSGTVTPPPPPPAAPAVPAVSLSALIAAFHHDSQPSVPTGSVSYPPAIYVERALNGKGLLAANRVDGSAGTSTVAAYAAWQRHCGYSGAAADGYPGVASLSRLGRETGQFTVIN